MSNYLLSRHVFLCPTEDGIVFLDLKRDRYAGLDHAQARALASVVQGWPHAAARGGVADIGSAGNAATIVDTLLGEGMLTDDGLNGKDAAPVAFEPPRSVLVDDDNGDEPDTSPGHLMNFAMACAAATFSLRWRRLENIVRRAADKKRSAAAVSFDLDAARNLTRIFLCLRPFAFTARDACLFDSLALLNFLSHYRVFPTWVFGVRTGPFGAHSWLQQDGFVFNGTVEYVRAFTPIMVV